MDIGKLAQEFARLPDVLRKQGRKTALRRAMVSGRALAVKNAREEFKIKAADLKKSGVAIKFNDKEGDLTIKGTRFNLGYFLTESQARNMTKSGRRKKGLRVSVKRSAGVGRGRSANKLIPGAFTIPRAKLRSTAGFRREGYAVFVRRKTKKGIRQLFAVSAPEMLTFKNDTSNLLQRHMAQEFEKQMRANYEFYTKQIIAGAAIGKKTFKFK